MSVSAPTDRAAALERVAAWPTTPLGSFPTPLVPMPRLAEELGLDGLLVKMDSETGFALGGNKVRKLEFELSPDRISGRTCLITAGGPQSNHCRVTAAFAARHGLDCVLVTQGPEPAHPTGNALIHRLFGARVHTVQRREDRVPGMSEMAEEVRRAGGNPLVVPIGASTGLGCLGYVRAAVELVEQLDARPDRASRTLLFSSASSCGTLAGLVLGLALLEREDIVPVAISADATVDEIRQRTLEIAAEGAELLGTVWRPDPAAFEVSDAQVGEGYGIPTDESRGAIERFGRAGVILDPTYTAKAAAGLVARVRDRGVDPDERIVFLHTGGHPGLLA